MCEEGIVLELVLESGQKIYMEESLEGAVARLYGKDGFLIEQREFNADFLCYALFGGSNGVCAE